MILDNFTILFSSNSKNLRQDLSDTEKAYDSLAKKVEKTADEKKHMAELEKSIKSLRGELEKYDTTKSKAATSLIEMAATGVAAFASWEGLKNGIKAAQDLNIEIYRASQLTGENAHELSVWDDVFTQATGKRGEFLSFFTSYSQMLQRTGQDTRNAMPNIRAFVKELDALSPKERDIRFASIAQANGIPLDFALALKNANFEEVLSAYEKIDHVTKETTEHAKQFDTQWAQSTKKVSSAFSDLWDDINPIFTAIMKWADTPASTTGILATLATAAAAIAAFFGAPFIAAALGVGAVGLGLAAVSGSQHQKAIDEETHIPVPGNSNAPLGIRSDNDEGTHIPVPGNSNAPLGIRSNNPGNLQPGGVERVFPTLAAGIAAEQEQLQKNYARGINTLTKIAFDPAHHWPDRSNAYSWLATVSRISGFKPNESLDLTDSVTLAKVANGINVAENGPSYGSLINTAQGAIQTADNSNAKISGMSSGLGGRDGPTLNVGDITINTQATDADAIAVAINDKLNYHFRNTVSNYDDVEAL